MRSVPLKLSLAFLLLVLAACPSGPGGDDGGGDGDEEVDGGACADGACSPDGGAIGGDGDGDEELDGGPCADGGCAADGGVDAGVDLNGDDAGTADSGPVDPLDPCVDNVSDGGVVAPPEPASPLPPDAGPAPEDGCAAADALVEQQNGVGGTFYDATRDVDIPGDVHFYQVPASASGWVQLVTDTEASAPQLNTTLTLYPADGSTQLAFNDDNLIFGGDSELFYRQPAAADQCVRVAVGASACGLSYRVAAVPIDFGLYDYLVEEAEGNGTANTAQTVALPLFAGSFQQSRRLLSTWSDGADVDFYAIDFPENAARVDVFLTPSGPQGTGGTAEMTTVRMYAADGTTVFAELDARDGARGLSLPNVAAGVRLLEVASPSGLGANPFYTLVVSATELSSSDEEADDVANGTAGGAQALNSTSFGNTTQHFLRGAASGGDADWWSFSAAAGDEISLACASRRAGSGVLDFTVELFDAPQGTSLASEVESPTADLRWISDVTASRPPVPATLSGTHYLRLSATTQSSTVAGDFYACGVFVTSP